MAKLRKAQVSLTIPLAKLVENRNVRKYLLVNHPSLLEQFEKIAEIQSLNQEMEEVAV